MSAAKKRVVVLGSKPGAVIPEGDAVYCANGAIGYYADRVRRFPKVVSILNTDLIHPKKRREGAPDRDFYERQWQMILESKPDRMILTRTTSFGLLQEMLLEAGFSSPVSGVSAYDRRMLAGRISGCYDPIVTTDFFWLPVESKLRYAGSLASTFLKRIVNNRKDCGSAFRPSTGVLSLVFAIDEYGHDAEYVVCGIGMQKRTEYLDGKNMKHRDLPPHVFADRKVLGRLARRYSVFTTEPELMQLLPSFNGSDG